MRIKKLTLTLSWEHKAFQIKYARPRHVVRGVTYYDFAWSIRFIKPSFRAPRLRIDDKRWLPFSCIVQDALLNLGIAMCNPFRSECTSGWECCNWNISDADKAILNGLMGCPGDVYVIHNQKGTCRCCGKTRDLRLGVCFDCAEHVVVEEVVPGITALHDTKGDTTWIP